MQEKQNFKQINLKKDNKFLKIMKIYFLITFLCVFSMAAENTYSQSKSVTAELKGVTLREALQEIEQNSDYLFLIMDNTESGLSKTVNVSFANKSIEEIMDLLLKNTDLVYSIVNRQITISRERGAMEGAKKEEATPVTREVQQTHKTITGRVRDANGEFIVGANIVEVGTTNGTITDINGNFSLNVANESTIQITYIGYLSQTVKTAGSVTFNITLREDTQALEELVVVGYGTQTKANLTGAVSTVDVGKTLEARPYSDISKALQGAVPGLSVISNSGKLGAQPSVTIRGLGTLSNDATSKPLIVVDGVPMDDLSLLNTQDIENISVLKDAASTSIYGTRAAFGVILITTKSARQVDRVSINYTNNFAWDTSTILPDYPDVPTQLKALIAANGRAGLANELFGMYLDEMLPYAEKWRDEHNGQKSNYREMILGHKDTLTDSSKPLGDFILDNNGVGMYFADWDVVNIMFRNWKPSQSHNLSLQGVSGKTSYYMSVGYNHDEGIMTYNPEKLDKWTTMLNLTTDVNDWLQVGARFNYSNKDFSGPATRRTTYQYMWRWGSFFGPYGTYQGIDMRNDIAYRKQAGDWTDNNSFIRMGTFAKATLAKGLTLNADYTYNVNNYTYKAANIPLGGWNSWGGAIENTTLYTSSSWLEQQSDQDKTFALNIYGNYEFSLPNNHNLNLMLGGNAEGNTYFNHYSERDDLLDYNLPEFDLATGAQYVDGAHSHWATAGYFGRVNYNYNGKWLLELNGRYDGSSRFPVNDRWVFFKSASAGYRMSEESFFENLKESVNNLKLRASYGEIGNQAVGNNMYLSTLAKRTENNTYWLADDGTKVVAYDLPKLVSSTLKWERIQTLDIGADAGFFNNELNFTFDWYQRTTKDMLAPGQTMPQVLGATAPFINAGTLRTRGWELNVDWRHRFNDVQVYANANVGDFITDITKWDNETKLLNQNYSGKRYGDIWGFETDRYFTTEDFNSDGTYKTGIASQTGLQQGTFVFGPGDIKFKDLDGSGVIDGGNGTADDYGDLKVIGNTTPRYQYSFRLGGEWRGFDIDLFFQGVGKRSVWTQSAFVMPMMRGADAIYENQTNYWTEENPDSNADFPRLFPGNAGRGTIAVLELGNHNFYPQSKYIVDMAYLRFKNMTLGYTLSADLASRIHMQKARIYFSANNLMELINKSNAPVDPEVNDKEEGVSLGNATWGRIDPMYRTISVGVQLTF
jgi:TonB-linked SusC/RagA family outer membrane protein